MTTTDITPPQKYIDLAAVEKARERSWCESFCYDCEAIEVHPDIPRSCTDPGEPGYSECPTDFDPLDDACVRRDWLIEDEAILELARELMNIDEETEGDRAA